MFDFEDTFVGLLWLDPLESRKETVQELIIDSDLLKPKSASLLTIKPNSEDQKGRYTILPIESWL